MNEFKKDLACNISLICVLCFVVTHITLITLNLFGVTNFAIPENFNYIVAYAMIIVSLALYVGGFFVTKLKNVTLPSWLRILFYVAFFVFTNTYYLTGLYENIIALLVFFAYIAFLITVISLSIFYNVQKDDKNRLKSSKPFIITSVFFYSAGACLVFGVAAAAVQAFIFSGSALSTISTVVAELSMMLLVCILMTLSYSLSLSKNKVFINSCLVKYNSSKTVTRSIKQ